jgi:hypothetical protein
MRRLRRPVDRFGRFRGLVLVLAACGARVDAGADDTFEHDRPDAAPSPADAPISVADNECGVAETQGELGTLAAAGSARVQDPDVPDLLVYALVAATPATAMDAEPDAIYVELWDGYGVFADGNSEPGTYAIAGEELDYATCGICVFTLADLDPDDGASHVLQAVSGALEVRAVSPDVDAPLAVELHGVRFREVDPDDFSPVNSDCESPVDRAALEATLESIDQ